ncbi:alpha/beta fold hydrolase [Streptomyces sp. URMC 123]|uniref:alpha/beta fold hydrolase n=1 Tax=Streptomyces sp. URMC 123 TaxID=3423403 RepID=UPI003F1C5425
MLQPELAETPRVAEPRVERFRYAGFSYECRLTPCDRALTEPVILLGGFIQDKDAWRVHELAISQWATTVSIDLPGSGEADPLPPDHGTEFLADALHHALESLDMPSVNAVGCSYGTLIARELAHRHPGRVARLALSGMATLRPGKRIAWEDVMALARVLEEGRKEDFAREMIDLLMRGEGAPRARRATIVAKLVTHHLSTLPGHKVAKYLQNVARMRHAHETFGAFSSAERSQVVPRVPTLVFTGESDSLTPPEEGRRFARACGDARFTTIKDCGHMVMLERAGEFTDLLRHFFTDAPLAGLPYCNQVE